VAAERAQGALAARLALRLEARGHHVTVTGDPAEGPAADTDLLLSLLSPSVSVSTATALALPLLHLDARTLDEPDLELAIEILEVRTSPLVRVRIGNRPSRIAVAEVVVAAQHRDRRELRAAVPGHGTIDGARIRVSNGDPLGVLEGAPTPAANGVTVEWADGANGITRTTPITGPAEVTVVAATGVPFIVRADGGRMSAIADRVRISPAPPVLTVRRAGSSRRG
jgi:hypothetical protein